MSIGEIMAITGRRRKTRQGKASKVNKAMQSQSESPHKVSWGSVNVERSVNSMKQQCRSMFGSRPDFRYAGCKHDQHCSAVGRGSEEQFIGCHPMKQAISHEDAQDARSLHEAVTMH